MAGQNQIPRNQWIRLNGAGWDLPTFELDQGIKESANQVKNVTREVNTATKELGAMLFGTGEYRVETSAKQDMALGTKGNEKTSINFKAEAEKKKLLNIIRQQQMNQDKAVFNMAEMERAAQMKASLRLEGANKQQLAKEGHYQANYEHADSTYNLMWVYQETVQRELKAMREKMAESMQSFQKVAKKAINFMFSDKAGERSGGHNAQTIMG